MADIDPRRRMKDSEGEDFSVDRESLNQFIEKSLKKIPKDVCSGEKKVEDLTDTEALDIFLACGEALEEFKKHHGELKERFDTRLLELDPGLVLALLLAHSASGTSSGRGPSSKRRRRDGDRD
jgi:hypothetical protein